MIIGLYMLINLMINGSSDPYLIPDSDKLILSVMENEEREEVAEEIIDRYELKVEEFGEWKDGHLEEFWKASEDKNTKSSTLSDKAILFREKQIALDKQLIPIRLELIDYMSDNEWSSLIKEFDRILEESKSEDVEEAELEEKIEQTKRFKKLQKAIEESIEDEERLKASFSALDDFEESISNQLKAHKELIDKSLTIFANKNVKAEELEQTFSTYHDFRLQLMQSFLELREQLVKSTDEKEWEKLHKKISKLI